jgi:hypothetical protein
MSTSPSTRPVELFATLGLALSTLIALTAVSIGIARADGLTTERRCQERAIHCYLRPLGD